MGLELNCVRFQFLLLFDLLPSRPVQSRTSGCVVSDILHTQPFSTEEYTINMIAGNECRAEYASHPRPDLNSPSNWACRPLLHLCAPCYPPHVHITAILNCPMAAYCFGAATCPPHTT